MNNLSSPIAILLLFLFPFSVLSAAKIDVNTALADDLVKICHIGDVRAEELISLRPFSSIDDLTKIKGISEARVEDIKEQGLAWVDPHHLILSVGVDIQEKPEPEPEPKPEPQPEPEIKPITYPSSIIINEILPSPEGPDAENEWIELFNQNDFEVNLSGWKIMDIVGKTKSYIFPEETKIEKQGFLILDRPKTKITLNNSGDHLKLFQPDGKIIDEAIFEKALLGQSFNRFETNWKWSSILTPNSVNALPEPKKITEDSGEVRLHQTSNIIPKPEKITENSSLPIASLAAAIQENEQTAKPSESLYTFLIALGIAIFSGTIILFLKKKLKNN